LTAISTQNAIPHQRLNCAVSYQATARTTSVVIGRTSPVIGSAPCCGEWCRRTLAIEAVRATIFPLVSAPVSEEADAADDLSVADISRSSISRLSIRARYPCLSISGKSSH
jgi:hypothetical protein